MLGESSKASFGIFQLGLVSYGMWKFGKVSFGMIGELDDVNMLKQKFKLTRIYPTKQEFFNTMYFS